MLKHRRFCGWLNLDSDTDTDADDETENKFYTIGIREIVLETEGGIRR